MKTKLLETRPLTPDPGGVAVVACNLPRLPLDLLSMVAITAQFCCQGADISWLCSWGLAGGSDLPCHIDRKAARFTLEELSEDLDLRSGNRRAKQTAFWTMLLLSAVIATAGLPCELWHLPRRASLRCASPYFAALHCTV